MNYITTNEEMTKIVDTILHTDIIVGDSGLEDFIDGTISFCSNSNVENIYSYAFYHCSNLTSVNFPACTSIDNYAFLSCSNLTSANFPMCTQIKIAAFQNCYNLSTISFPVCTSIGNDAFQYCSNLTSVTLPACIDIRNGAFKGCISLSTASFPACTSIGGDAFYQCSNLMSLYLTGSSYVLLSNWTAFVATPISKSSAGQYGSIYVPASMLASYKTRTNWTYYSKRFVGI